MSAEDGKVGLYGSWPGEIAPCPSPAVQFSPTIPGSADLEEIAASSLSGFALLAPPGTIERRAVLALALRGLAAGAPLTALAPNDKGGTRLAAELEAFGCAVERRSKRHHRICTTRKPDAPVGLETAIDAGAPRRVETLDGWSQPGVFSWDRVDPGSALLAETLPRLAGRVVDLGCGVGVLSRAILRVPDVTGLTMVDIDRRAVACARRNVSDPRAEVVWADARDAGLTGVDAVVTNPPFHTPEGREEQAVGQAFLRAAAGMLRKGGSLVLVANRHLAYEGVLREIFADVTVLAERDGFKVLRARR